MKKALLLAAAIVAAGPACADWEKVAESEDSGFVFYMDFGTLRFTGAGAVRRIWTMYDRLKPSSNAGLSTKILFEFDCQEERSRPLQVQAYKEHRGSGSLIPSGSGPVSQDWEYISPETIRAKLLALACTVAPAYVRK